MIGVNNAPLVEDRFKCVAEIEDRHVSSDPTIKGFWPVIDWKNQLGFTW